MLLLGIAIRVSRNIKSPHIRGLLKDVLGMKKVLVRASKVKLRNFFFNPPFPIV